MLRTVLQIFLIAVLPVAIGMSIRGAFPAFASTHLQSAKRLALIMLIVHMSLVIVRRGVRDIALDLYPPARK